MCWRTATLMDNFIMDAGQRLYRLWRWFAAQLFSYAGKNGWPYRSIGKVLIDRGEVKKEDMSMQAIREWGEQRSGSA